VIACPADGFDCQVALSRHSVTAAAVPSGVDGPASNPTPLTDGQPIADRVSFRQYQYYRATIPLPFSTIAISVSPLFGECSAAHLRTCICTATAAAVAPPLPLLSHRHFHRTTTAVPITPPLPLP